MPEDSRPALLALAHAHVAISVHNGYMSTKRHRDVAHITIRFPREVADALRRLAQEHDRSLNGEVIRAAREYIARRQQQEREGC